MNRSTLLTFLDLLTFGVLRRFVSKILLSKVTRRELCHQAHQGFVDAVTNEKIATPQSFVPGFVNFLVQKEVRCNSLKCHVSHAVRCGGGWTVVVTNRQEKCLEFFWRQGF